MATLACNFVSDKSASGEQLLNGVGGQVGIQVVDRAEVPHFRAIEGLDELSSKLIDAYIGLSMMERTVVVPYGGKLILKLCCCLQFGSLKIPNCGLGNWTN